VRKEGKGWGVIAGRRRLFALKKKANETGTPQKAPCVIMESGNVKAAREASLLENVARVPATQLEQFAAYKALADAGKDAAEIGIRTGTVQALTMATTEQQGKWLELYHSDDYAPTDYHLKNWLTGDAQIETKDALFDMADFDGAIITDLFGDTEYFADPDQFWPLQNTAIAEAVSEWKEQGWTDVIVLERGSRFDRYEHGKRERENGGKIYIEVGHDGTVTPYIGYLPKSDIKKIDNILGLNTDGKPKAKSRFD